MLEMQRVFWSECVTQYLALCSTILSPNFIANSSAGDTSGSKIKTTDKVISNMSDIQEEKMMLEMSLSTKQELNEWLRGHISHCTQMLAKYLQLTEDGAQLKTLLQQSTFTLRRAGRFGADGSKTLSALFEARIKSIVRATWADSSLLFKDEMLRWSWVFKAAVSQLPGSTGGAPDQVESGKSDALSPSPAFLRFSPVADLVNSFLHVYNTLRHCMPSSPSFQRWLSGEFAGLLETIVQAVQAGIGAGASLLSANAIAQAARRRNALSAGAAAGLEDAASVQRFFDAVSCLRRDAVPFLFRVLEQLMRNDHVEAFAESVEPWKGLFEKTGNQLDAIKEKVKFAAAALSIKLVLEQPSTVTE
jgi:hypothetical protein